MSGERWLTPKDVAEIVGIGVDAVYKSEPLRRVARTLSEPAPGKRPRLRWTLADLDRAFPTSDTGRDPAAGNVTAGAAPAGPVPPSARTRRRSLPGQAPLLEIRPPRRRP